MTHAPSRDTNDTRNIRPTRAAGAPPGGLSSAPPRPTDTNRRGCPCAVAGTASSRPRAGLACIQPTPSHCGQYASTWPTCRTNPLWSEEENLAAKREPITAPDAPEALGPYVHAVRTDGLLFCSGQIPIEPRT